MIRLTLYTTQGCHLCETLEAWLARLAGVEYRLARVEIADDEALLARFGERIPVLLDEASGEALEGGVAPSRLADWLAARGWLDEAAWQAEPGDDEAPRSGGVIRRRGRRYLL
ncbi:glutaredoxin family protein [Halomonas borealis]|uniref:glutaredoxin family protein n=1 Tax=Halomonas borealis TaxID=2508710 RepID=UPI0010A0566F|nr:glutaredoxin family protein [Halomonas borealis]